MVIKRPFPWPISARAIFLLAFSVISLTEVDAKSPKASGRVIIVMDASASMWEEVSGGSKMEVAREAVSEMVTNLDSSLALGLMAYGHRREGDCGDVELLVPPQVGDSSRKAVIDAVQGIVPKGKTPLGRAVLQAAEALNFEESRATVILISDGLETCGLDSCAVGETLSRRGIDFVCHVIGFDLEVEEQKALSCLSEKTGGLFFQASDAATLRDSLNRAMETVVEAETHLVISARNRNGAFLDGVEFEIYEDESKEEPAYSGTGGKFRQRLEPGTYQVVARFGGEQIEGEATIVEGRTSILQLQFKATGLRARALLSAGGERIERGLSWRVYDKPANAGDRKSLAYSFQAEPVFYLPPGNYYLQAKKEEATVVEPVTVSDSRETDITLTMAAGILDLRARMSQNEPALEEGLSWELLTFPDREGDRRRVAYSHENKPRLVAPAGSYLLTVKHGGAYSEKEVRIRAGETTEELITFGAGVLRASAVMTEGAEPITGDLSWKLFSMPDSEGKRKRVSYSYEAEPSFKVTSGKYTLQVTRGAATSEVDVVVAAGKPTEKTLNLNAGIWEGSALMAGEMTEPVAEDLNWKVYHLNRERKGKRAIYSYEGQPRFCLSGGQYLVELSRGAARTTATIGITPGETREDVLVLDAGTVLLRAPERATKFKWLVFRENSAGERGERLGYGYSRELLMYLPAGPCLVEMELGVGNEIIRGKKAISVEAGQYQEIQF